jgi:hypothetical protein
MSVSTIVPFSTCFRSQTNEAPSYNASTPGVAIICTITVQEARRQQHEKRRPGHKDTSLAKSIPVYITQRHVLGWIPGIGATTRVWRGNDTLIDRH